MHLSPSDTEKLLLSVAGMVARDRLARGVAQLPGDRCAADHLGDRTGPRGRRRRRPDGSGREVLTRDQVMDGVAEMLADVQVEATFPDGRKLVTLHQPIA